MTPEGSACLIGSIALGLVASAGYAQCPGDCPTSHETVVDGCETRFDAHCVVLTSGGSLSGTGTLISPQHVLTAKHLLPTHLQNLPGTAGDTRSFPGHVFYFRRLEDGTAAPTDIAPQSADPSEFLVRTSTTIHYTTADDDIIIRMNEAIDPALIAPREATCQFIPAPRESFAGEPAVPRPLFTKDIETAGWGRGPGSSSASTSRLRWRCGPASWTAADKSFSNGAGGTRHDSGSPVPIDMPNGIKRIIGVLDEGEGTGSEDFGAFGAENRKAPFGFAQNFTLPDGSTVFFRNGDWKDVTGDAAFGGDAYARPDLILDLNDLVYVRAAIDAGDPAMDLTTSSLPTQLNYAVPDGLVNETDWDYYVYRFANDPHPYSYIDLPIPRCDSLDTDGDNRLSSADLATLSSLVNTSGDAVKPWDLDGDNTFEAAELSAIQAVAALYPAQPFGDINGDGAFDEYDFALLRTPPGANESTWFASIWEVAYGDPAYDLELDFDLDGDNDYSDLGAMVSRFVPGDIVDASRAAAGQFSLPYALVDFDVTVEDVWSLLIARDGNSNSRRAFLIDVTGSIDPSSDAFGVPDGDANRLDVAYLLSELFSDPAFDAVGTQILKAPVDPNGDGRFNFADYQWYINNDQLATGLPPFTDLDGNGIIESSASGDAGRIFVLLTDIIESNDADQIRMDISYGTVPSGGALFPFAADAQHYDHGVVGDWDLSEDRTRTCFQDTTVIEPLVSYVDRVFHPDFCPPDIGTGTPSADCTDYCEMLDAINAGDFAFDGRRFGEDGYRFTMDWDLDGDNDTDDEPYIKQRQFPGDVNFDGVATGADWNAWTTLFANGDLLADSNFDGNLTGADWNAFLNAQLTPCSCP